MDGDGQIHDDSTNFKIGGIGYIDRVIKTLNEKIESKCSIWELELSGVGKELESLRREWILEHKNLIQRFESEQEFKSSEKIEVDKHFERINELQARMDKLSMTFLTTEQVDYKIKLAIADQNKYITILMAIIVAALGVIGYFLGAR
jgi:ribosome assembly protein YihI (activator of Der GTPase)